MEDRDDFIDKRKSSVALLSVTSNTALVLLKLTIGIMIGSVSVISEAINSGVDLLAAVIALFAVRTSGKPADTEHPFGHGKVENISGTVEALLIFLAAGWIIFEAAKKLRNPEPLEDVGWGVAVMTVSSAANIMVSRRLFKVGKETDSVALQADAWHLRTDVYTSAGVMAGLAIIWIGKFVLPGTDLDWVDPIAAIGVALLIIKAAYKLTVESSRDLLDVSLPKEEEAFIKKRIAAFAPAVRGFHRLLTRKSGSHRFVEFHMIVDPSMSIDESHRIADMVTCSIKQQYSGTTVNIHIEPCNCNPAIGGKCDCLLSAEDKEAIKGKGPENSR
ncbi:MAG TPA: cation diffusion facilitator family transporter [Methanotrichaceae archaeon]|nr:cation diffusion facilitator family transporter [Methanotrichaceae archaeon]